VRTGYIYTDLWYKEEGGVDRRDHSGYLDAAYELSSQLSLNTGYQYTLEDSDRIDYDRHDARGGFQYKYAGDSYGFFTIGNSWFDFKEIDRYSKIFWDAGIIHNFTAFESSLTSARDYIKGSRGGLKRRDSYVLALHRTAERVIYGISLAFREYTDAIDNVLETRRYGIYADIAYELTSKLTGIIDFTAEKFEEELENTYTRRYRPTVEIKYLLLEDLILGFRYRYVDSSSPKIQNNNYKSNRFLVQITKRFF
jgi:uncharacterized protein (PEP-CTERM system associated)